jgi:hypothetical protein
VELANPNPFAFSPAHERPTRLTAALTGRIQYRGHQCALQLADRGGSARDRHCRTAGASLLRRRCASPGLMRWFVWWSRASPSRRTRRARLADRCASCAGTRRAMQRARWQRSPERRMASRSTTDFGKRLRNIEMLKSRGMSNRAIAHRVGVCKNAIRKLVGPSKPTKSCSYREAKRPWKVPRRGRRHKLRAGPI